MANNLLKGNKGIIFGALDHKSIAWKVALESVKNGAQIILTNAPIALRMGSIDLLADQCKAKVIPADATSLKDLEIVCAANVKLPAETSSLDYLLLPLPSPISVTITLIAAPL